MPRGFFNKQGILGGLSHFANIFFDIISKFKGEKERERERKREREREIERGGLSEKERDREREREIEKERFITQH